MFTGLSAQGWGRGVRSLPLPEGTGTNLTSVRTVCGAGAAKWDSVSAPLDWKDQGRFGKDSVTRGP